MVINHLLTGMILQVTIDPNFLGHPSSDYIANSPSVPPTVIPNSHKKVGLLMVQKAGYSNQLRLVVYAYGWFSVRVVVCVFHSEDFCLPNFNATQWTASVHT